MAENTVSEGWIVQRQLLKLVQEAPGGGVHRSEIVAELGLTWPYLWRQGAGQLYGRGLVDFCGAYLVTVPRPRQEVTRPRTAGDSAQDHERQPSCQLRLVPRLADNMRAARHA